MTLKQIQAEKLKRCRSWYLAKVASGDFPAPLDTNGCGPNIWEENLVDQWVAKFIADAKQRAIERDTAAERSKHARKMVDARRSRRQPSASTQTA